MRYILRHFSRDGSGIVNLAERMVLIGSSPESDVVLRNAATKEVGVKIEPDAHGHFVETLYRGPVRLNGEKVQCAKLALGDRLEIGEEVFIYDACVDAPRQSPPIANHSFASLHTLIESVGKERDLQKLLSRLIGTLIELLNGSDAFIFKLDYEGKPQNFVSTARGVTEDRFSDTIVQTVLKTGKGCCIGNALSDPAFSHSQSVADLLLSSVICAPIFAAGSLIGIVYVGSRNPAVSFSESDLNVLGVYAAIAGMLINHVDYIRAQNKAICDLTRYNANDGFIAESPAMHRVLSSIKAIAESDITALLEGPTGCGKNHLAELIHKRSGRARHPFIVVNCSSLKGELFESELFGHRKGSFTGAVEDHSGLFAMAKGGTLLLDEIGELELPIQAKLLRVLESNLVRPLGSAKEIAVDVRVLCATNRNLSDMAARGTFRSDLYYRVNQFSIPIPPLCERGDDVVLLAYFYLEQYKARYPGKEIVDFHPETLRYIQRYEWPGNIRELSNSIHRAVLSSDGPLLHVARTTPVQDPSFDFETATEAFQKALVQKAVQRTGGNKEEAAKLLGLSRSTFFRYQASLGA